MIKLKRQNFPNVEISRCGRNDQGETHEWFFEQCLIEDVLGTETLDGELVDTITLYQMESIPSMLSLFGSSGGVLEASIIRLSQAIRLECENFNPNDTFWSKSVS